MAILLDPMFNDDELCFDAPGEWEFRECERCGKECLALYEVEDCDPAVGYYSTIKVGSCCLERS